MNALQVRTASKLDITDPVILDRASKLSYEVQTDEPASVLLKRNKGNGASHGR